MLGRGFDKLRIMKVFFNRMFTRFYLMYYKSGEKSDAQYTSVLLIGLIVFINAYSVFSLFELFIAPKMEYSYWWLAMVQAIILIICYFIFVHKGKYKEIIKQDEGRKVAARKKDWILIAIYIASSLFIWVFLAVKLRAFHV